jgi:hypothetical protein
MRTSSACLITGGSVFIFFILIIGLLFLILVNPFKKVNRPTPFNKYLIDIPILKSESESNPEIKVIYLGDRIQKDVNSIKQNEYIELGDYIKSSNEKYYFRLNLDGSVCLTESLNDKNGDIYTCITKPNDKIKYGLMDKSGNFKLIDEDQNIIFQTNTDNCDSYVKILDNGIIGIFNKENDLIYNFFDN